ncbi:hypothetical protein ACFYO9_34160 [Streptomyces sp. NPDC005863]|uniref:hypothetical protein n=1 Tax=Streptomyces sp. NPDC005863 TaxID=3364735 RepID=UPI0036AB64C5
MAAMLLAALTACGGRDDGETDEKPPSGKAAATENPGNDGDGIAAEKTLKLGEPAQTIGDEGVGVLQITPGTTVYAKAATSEKPENGVFVVVTMKVKAMTGVAAEEVAPISGGGWQWIAPDGESIGWNSGNSTAVSTGKYENAGKVQPGTYHWESEVFDLTATQAKGGTLMYTDGDGTAHEWKMPSTDTGPDVAEVKKELQP